MNEATTTASKPRAPRGTSQHRSNAIVDEETQRRAFTEALEHGVKPWSVDTQPAHVRAAVEAMVGAVESTMRKSTTGSKAVRPLAAVQALVANTFLMGFHAGRHYETVLAKAKRTQSTAAGKATRAQNRVTTTNKADKPAQP